MTKKEILEKLEEIREDTMYIANPKNTTEFCGVVYAMYIDDLIEELKKETEKANEI